MYRLFVASILISLSVVLITPVQTPAFKRSADSSTITKVGDGEVSGLRIKPGKPANLAFTFPKDAKQGPNKWYTVKLHARVEIAPYAKRGVAFLTASTGVPGKKNRWTSAQIEFDVKREKGRTAVDVSSIGIFSGLTHFETRRRSIEVVFMNYLPKRGVKEGLSDLHIEIEEERSALSIISAIILPDTSISETGIPPPHLRLDVAPLKNGQLKVGRENGIEWRLTNDSQIPARAVSVDLNDFYGGLRLRGRSHYFYREVKGTVQGVFRYLPTRSGKLEYYISVASTTANQPTVRINTTVATEGGTSTNIKWMIRTTGIVLMLMVISTIAIRRTSRRKQRRVGKE